MLLVLKRSQAQETALEALLAQQHDPASSNFRQWLTPQQFGERFGPSDQDIQTITTWLESHGFTVNSISSGRTVIEFSGSAGQVRQAFHTTMHRYAVNGVDHWANSSDPEIPAALAPVVAGINTLYNFPRQSMHEFAGTFDRNRATGALKRTSGPQFTFPIPCTTGPSTASDPFCSFALGPADFAKIYNVPNLALVPAASTPYNGDGQTIAIVGESDINPNDVATFRTLFGLPAPQLNIIVNGPDPGVNAAESEGDIDVQWAGAVAPNATIDYVVAQGTEVSLGVDLAAQYAVDNNLGSVLNESYGICEFFMGSADNVFYNQLWQQAAAQGITVTVASGDGGSAACDQNAGTGGPAEFGLSVSGFTSTPYNVSVGGTDFNDISNFAQFWNTTPVDTPTVPSALGYIPEMTWNNSCTNQELFALFGVTTAEESCNNATENNDGFVGIGGGSGGQSNCTVSDGVNESSCSGGYAKPSWQMPLTPNDGARDIPDLSFFASNGFNDTFYIICQEDLLPTNEQTGNVSCDPNATVSSFAGFGGTSVSTPAFAGIVALVNQATNSRQGNANYILYKLAAQSGASCTSAPTPASTCVFYDVPAGSTIAMPCVVGVPTTTACPSNTFGTTGVLSGYSTTAGYDLATGLGSVNAANLISNWQSFGLNLTPSSTNLTLNNGSAVNITHGQSVQVTVNVSGSGSTPTGTASLIAQTSANTEQGAGSANLSNGSATFSTISLPGGSYSVFAQYSGDNTFKSSSSATESVTVAPEASKIEIAYETIDPTTGAIANSNASTAAYGQPALLRINVTSQAGDACVQRPQDPSETSGCPTGSITLTDNGMPLDAGTYALNSQGYSEDQAIALPSGTHLIQASYAGDASYTSSTGTDPVVIAGAFITITASAPFTNVFYQANNTINATLSGVGHGVAPTGQVTFFSGATQLGDPVPLTNAVAGTPTSNPHAQATINTLLLPLGLDGVTAQYSGDSNYAASTSAALAMSVRILTGCFPSSSSSTIAHGGSVTFTAKVTATPNVGPGPTGTITFSVDGGPTLGVVPLTNGQAQITTSSLPGGNLTIDASYSGDANYWPSASDFGETVTLLPATVSLATSSSSLAGGSPVTFTATVAPTQTGGPTLTGTMQFLYYFNANGTNTNLGSAVTISNGNAQLTTTTVPGGTVFVAARYNGDSNYASSVSSPVTETVSKITTTETFSASSSSALTNTYVTFNVQVLPAVTGGIPLTGTVQLMANGASVDSQAIFPTGQVPLLNFFPTTGGTYQVQAVYSGDSSYSSSTSSTITVTVTQASRFEISANPTSITISAPGKSASTTLTFTSVGGLTGSGALSSATCGTSSAEEITCTMSAFTLPVNGTTTATLTFNSTAASRTAPTATNWRTPRGIAFLCVLCALAIAFASRRKNRRDFVLGALVFAIFVLGAACGGGSSGGGGPSNPGTPVGAVQPLIVSITINGTSETVPNLTVTVQ